MLLENAAEHGVRVRQGVRVLDFLFEGDRAVGVEIIDENGAQLGIVAIREALAQSGLTRADMEGWGVVAAPRYIGRLAGAAVLDKFPKSGNSGVPAHQVAQNSLHSVSGAASIALGLHGPNVGLGGGPWSVAEGLTTALSLFDPALVPGLWLLVSQFDPEPIPDAQGNPQNNPLCYAVAIALDWRSATPGRLSLALDGPPVHGGKSPWPEPTVPELAACIDAAARGLPTRWQCRLPWGGRLELRLAGRVDVDRGTHL